MRIDRGRREIGEVRIVIRTDTYRYGLIKDYVCY